MIKYNFSFGNFGYINNEFLKFKKVFSIALLQGRAS
jgi:hypothetical protein